MRGAELRHVTPGPQPSFTAPHNAVVAPKEFHTFFDKYLYPSSLKPNLRYHPSSGGGFMGRATYPASRIFIVRGDSGKGRLNTSSFLGALTSVSPPTPSPPSSSRHSPPP